MVDREMKIMEAKLEKYNVDQLGVIPLEREDGTMSIKSSIMSHITFKMCQFVLVIYLRDYHYNFYLDIVVLWSFYGVFRLTYYISKFMSD